MITPQTEHPDIAKELGVPQLWLKREDLHPYGSHKGRSIPVMIDLKVAEGKRDFAISSSGNAALAAVRHIAKRVHEGDKLTLSVLVGQNINPDKRAALLKEAAIAGDSIKIEDHVRPLQKLLELVTGGKESLRQSTDDDALIGYKPLAIEIAGTPFLSDVFVATSSGTTVQAIADYLAEHRTGVAVHVVQTTGNSPIAREFKAEEAEPAASLADAIVDKVAHRKDRVKEIVTKTGGTAWIATNADIQRAQELMRSAGVEATGNGALSLAGLVRARAKGREFKGSVVCVMTGK